MPLATHSWLHGILNASDDHEAPLVVSYSTGISYTIVYYMVLSDSIGNSGALAWSIYSDTYTTGTGGSVCVCACVRVSLWRLFSLS